MRSNLVFICVALMMATVACEQILGLDRYQKCDTLPCDASPESASVDASDASTDAFTLPDGVSEASSWPRWRMENTPTEVNNGASDASLTSFDAGTVGFAFDNVTGLLWDLAIGNASSFDAAAAYCTKRGDRLPTRIEIATLLDSTRKQGSRMITPTFDAPLADAGGPSLLWTSSYYRPIGSALAFWFGDLTGGDMKQTSSGIGGVLCVK